MSILFQWSLIAHVLAGILGVVSTYAIWIGLLKKAINIKNLKRWGSAGFVLMVVSWVTGGYYYTAYYGSSVRPVIKAGAYPWAHSLFMEWKEHVFLFLPFLTFILWLVVNTMQPKETTAPAWGKSAAALAGVTTVLGILIALSGVIISGAVR